MAEILHSEAYRHSAAEAVNLEIVVPPALMAEPEESATSLQFGMGIMARMPGEWAAEGLWEGQAQAVAAARETVVTAVFREISAALNPALMARPVNASSRLHLKISSQRLRHSVARFDTAKAGNLFYPGLILIIKTSKPFFLF